MSVWNLVSFAGIFALMILAWALSTDRRLVNVRVLVWGVGLQLTVAAVVFCAPGSRAALLWFNDAFVKVMQAAQAGQAFVFGPLAETDKIGGFALATQAFPLVIFFAALMGLLYYWRVMPVVIHGFAWVFTKFMRISGAESLCTASNIFVGIESATTVRPYLERMTRSEFCTILTAGMATVASTVLALYVSFLSKEFPTIAGHLVSASLLSAPAAIVMSKLLLPESGQPVTLGLHVQAEAPRESSAVEAVISGAMAGVKLVVGIVALLIALLGLLALVDLLLGGVSWHLFGHAWSLQQLLGYVFWPLTVAMGIPPADAWPAAQLLGERLVATEIPAYRHLAQFMAEGRFHDPRTPVILAYSLCGFAHVASLAIFVGGIASLVPSRRADLAKIGPRALLAATLACLMTGAVAGTFFHDAGIVLGSGTL